MTPARNHVAAADLAATVKRHELHAGEARRRPWKAAFFVPGGGQTIPGSERNHHPFNGMDGASTVCRWALVQVF